SEHVTYLFLPTAFFNLVIDINPETLRDISQIIVGGEAMSVVHIDRALTLLPDVELVNGYGPTENTTFTSYKSVKSPRPEWWTSVPIGRPLKNTQTMILDAFCQPAPLGVAGELCAAGDGLARGYLNRPDLTAEKFIPNPFTGDSGSRMYRTGDLARYSANGDIEFVCRQDRQVKIRGFRIEPGEIEAALCKYQDIRAALVTKYTDSGGQHHLVGYVVAEPGTVQMESLQAYLRGKLPEYMLPSVLIPLEDFPMTFNGKLDRSALPAPTAGCRASQEHLLPRTLVEQALEEIWAELLGSQNIGLHDNFFELGGRSLQAMQAAFRIQELFNTDLATQIFEYPTIASLAECIDAQIRDRNQFRFPPVAQGAQRESFPLSFGQEQLFFLQQYEPKSVRYNIAITLRIRGNLNVAALERALLEIGFRHESLRTRFVVVDGSTAQVKTPPPDSILQIVALDGIPADRRNVEAQ